MLALDPKNGRATRTLRESFLRAEDWEGLEALYADTNDWEGLVEVLGSAAERAADPHLKAQLSFRAAEVYETRIGEPTRAFRNYERVLSVDPMNVRAARALSPIYEKDENFARLVSMKEVLLASLGEGTELADWLALVEELRQLTLRRLSDPRASYGWAARAYALAPSDAAVVAGLEESAEAAGAWEDLAALYKSRVASASAEEGLRLRRRLAGLAGERLGRSGDAITQLESILEADPTDREAVKVLDRLYRAENRTSDLRRLFQHRIEHASDTSTKVECLRELASLEEDVLDDAASATSRFEALLTLEPDDPAALAALDRLYSAADRASELADVLRRRREIAVEDGVRIELVLRLGDLLRTRLDDSRGALDAYADVLRIAPGNERAVHGLETLEKDSPELSTAAGRLLESAYESKASFQKLATVLEKRLESTRDEDERRALRLRLAELAGSELGDVEGAYAALEAAFLDRPSDVELWDRLADAGERAGKHAELAAAYAKAIDSGTLGASDVTDLAARAARIHEEILGNPGAAEPFHRRVLHEDPLSDHAFEALKQLYTDAERWGELQVLYRNRIAHTIDAEQKLELLLQVCFLFEELLDDADLAIRAYQDVIELDPRHISSRRALDRFYRADRAVARSRRSVAPGSRRGTGAGPPRPHLRARAAIRDEAR